MGFVGLYSRRVLAKSIANSSESDKKFRPSELSSTDGK